MIKPNLKNGTGSKLEPVLWIQYSEMAIPNYSTINHMVSHSAMLHQFLRIFCFNLTVISSCSQGKETGSQPGWT